MQGLRDELIVELLVTVCALKLGSLALHGCNVGLLSEN